MTEEDKKELMELLHSIKTKDKKQDNHAKTKRGLTDKIFIAVAVFTVAAFIFSAALMWRTQDTSGLAYFIPSIAGFGTIVLTAIINKNQKENLNKHNNDIVNRKEDDNR